MASAASVDAPPPTLAGILAARLGRLSAPARGVVGALAIAGRPIDEALLATVMDEPTDSLDEPLRELRAAHVLETDGVSGDVRLRHVLLAEVALQELLPARRRVSRDADSVVIRGETLDASSPIPSREGPRHPMAGSVAGSENPRRPHSWIPTSPAADALSRHSRSAGCHWCLPCRRSSRSRSQGIPLRRQPSTQYWV